jgi:ATP-binding cassette subfamily B protein
MPKPFPHYRQLDAMDCGATCLRMIAKYYGKNYSLETLREKTYITREGVSMLGISEAAEKIGFKTPCVRINRIFCYFCRQVLTVKKVVMT